MEEGAIVYFQIGNPGACLFATENYPVMRVNLMMVERRGIITRPKIYKT